jgi:hypothetical protein
VIRGNSVISPLRPHDRARPDPAVQTEVWPRIWGGSSASGLPVCHIQTTCSSASDIEVQLEGHEEAEVICLPLSCRC